ncbi:FAD-binding oxidoreductase [Bacillus suaedaesalsae]|uniref:FAD-binding oxidoreductase n=1 Tax=Bacillus suaedaesalsae TaxID=2810349 RepID=A0ABS2DFY7_9BACI|nr:FAD-binding oxidoreductase [Bacillus suaedaesalsae]MBM6617393.1 FAD-binding oxidoreductase [Bacillus suaedaesalsae]
MKEKIIIFLIIFTYVILLISSMFFNKDGSVEMTDVSQLMPVKVEKVVKGKEEQSILQVIKEANENGKKVSIAGKRHSMGGHTYYKDSIVLDMTTYNDILDFNLDKKTITVQSGATWNDIQQYVNPYGLAVKVMQSQNIFTIGGSLSVNAHGRDIRYGSLIDSVRSFRLLTAEGEILHVSREENEELFYLVIGGYGLFGVILDVELELTEDELYVMQTKAMSYDEYTNYFVSSVKENEEVRMHLARISTSPENFLTKMYVTDYVFASEQKLLTDHDKLKEDRATWLTKFLLGLSRHYDWGKEMLWNMQEKYFHSINGELVSRNNVMRSESKFLEYEDANDTDVLQEYFVPIHHFTPYIDDLREELSDEELNLVNITIRYVNKNEDAVLSYAKDDMFALVLLINQGLSEEESEKAKQIVQKMIQVTLEHNGSYYLPYMPYPTKDQLTKAYPRSIEFFEKKLVYDPDELFYNYFYKEYKQ